jgi:chromosome partition protein MukE
MSDAAFPRLEDVVIDSLFPEVDLALRRGRHIDRDEGAAYQFLFDALDHLEPFYRRFGCELVHRSEGYFFLRPTGDQLGRSQLKQWEMLVGQVLALLHLEPTSVQTGGRVTRENLLGRLEMHVGRERLIKLFMPRKKTVDERVAQRTIREKVDQALRRLAALGFIGLDGTAIVLRAPLLRFVEPVRTAAEPMEALRQLVATGEVVAANLPSADSEPA